jgi:hypothetical protein
MAVTTAGANEYYLSPTGNDDAPGTRTHPWQTLAKANSSLNAGDTLTMLPGKYPGSIAPENPGTPGNPIAYRADRDDAVVLTGEGDTDAAVRLHRTAYVRIENLHIDTAGRKAWLNANAADHITITGCVMRNAGRAFDMFRCEQVKLLDNIFSMDSVKGNMVQLRECAYVLVEGNSFARVGHSPLQITVCRNVCVRANCFRNNWGRNYEFWSTGKLLVEENIVTQARDSGYSADSRAKNLYIDSIFRLNRVFGNLHTPLNSGSYMPMGARPTATFRQPFKLLNSRIYHNTITDNLGHGWEFYGLDISGNEFVNNIVAGNDRTGAGVQLLVSDRISMDNRFHNNLIAADTPQQKTILWGDSHWTTDELNARTPTWQFWTAGLGNVDAQPAFTNPEGRDYRITQDSPAVDAARALTLAIGSGSGRTLPVADGRFFYDGFGIEDERGDWICVRDSGQLARIERIEHRYAQAALLHLDREVTWEDGDPVGLPWTGKAPDIGWHEPGLSHPTRMIALAQPAQPAPGQPVQFGLDTLGKTVRTVHWRFADGTRSEKLAPEHAYDSTGQHGVIVRAEFTNGERAVAVAFVDVRIPQLPETPLVQADFEDATRDTEWGYQFKFYRRRLTGYAHEKRDIGNGKCMRLFRADGKANTVAGCVAPGAWDIDRYPFVRFSYRIPPDTPVGLCVEPFQAPGMPRRVLLGGTESRHGSRQDSSVAADTATVTLIDDNAWHTATIDVRAIRKVVPDLQYLRLFEFHCYWKQDADQEFRFDDFSILPVDANGK